MDAGTDPTQLSDADLATLITTLQEEERHLSARRTAVHLSLDFLRSGGYAHLDASADQLVELEREERGISEQRHALHGRLERALAERHGRASGIVR